jgi:hypothetical protein
MVLCERAAAPPGTIPAPNRQSLPSHDLPPDVLEGSDRSESVPLGRRRRNGESSGPVGRRCRIRRIMDKVSARSAPCSPATGGCTPIRAVLLSCQRRNHRESDLKRARRAGARRPADQARPACGAAAAAVNATRSGSGREQWGAAASRFLTGVATARAAGGHLWCCPRLHRRRGWQRSNLLARRSAVRTHCARRGRRVSGGHCGGAQRWRVPAARVCWRLAARRRRRRRRCRRRRRRRRRQRVRRRRWLPSARRR